MAYCQQLLQVVDCWGEERADEPDICTLPALTCEASGGETRWAMPIVAAWQLMRLAAKLLDDVEDGEAGDSFAEIVSLSTGLLFAASLMPPELLEQGVTPGCVRRLEQALHCAALRTCAGQHADLRAGRSGIDSLDPDTWLEIAQGKSGNPLGWAAWAGALVAGAGERALSGYYDYGCHLGVLLQVADDFKGVWASNGACDLAINRPILPVCYAMHVAEGKKRDRLKALLGWATQGDREAEIEAQQMLIDLGAQGYMLVVAKVQYQLAVMALRHAGCIVPGDQPLVTLLEQTMPAPELVSKNRCHI